MALTKYINVLVHGLFFMWLNQDTGFLELIAPRVDAEGALNPHHLVGGIRGFLQEYEYEDVIDWTQIGLIGSDPPSLKPGDLPANLKSSVLQFSMQSTGIKGWSDKSANFFGRFILPWPADFYSLRHDYWTRCFIYYPSKVGDAISNRCYKSDPNAEIGLVTCLQYTYVEGQQIQIKNWRPDINLHCYFEPCQKHSIPEVNADLKNASGIFSPPGAFDLQMNDKVLNGVVTRPGNNPSTPPGYDKNDEYSLTDDPQKPKDICTSPARYPLNVSPANCPNFFVGP
jgi:hypothetical protein